MRTIARLHFITQPVEGFTYPELVERACCAGVSWVQLRLKGVSFLDWVGIARNVRWVCQRYGATLIINDNPFVAKEVQADGVHLGQKDIDPREARALLGADAIIGGTANTLIQAKELAQKSVDYIGLGPFRFTKTKQELSPVLGLPGVHEVVEGLEDAGIPIPVIVVGGVTHSDVKALQRGGAHGVAVSTEITNALTQHVNLHDQNAPAKVLVKEFVDYG